MKPIKKEAIVESERIKSKLEAWPSVTNCRMIRELKKVFKLSERQIGYIFNKSKSEVHRMMSVAQLSLLILNKAEEHGTHYSTLTVLACAKYGKRRDELEEMILSGEIKLYQDAKKFMYPKKGVAHGNSGSGHSDDLYRLAY